MDAFEAQALCCLCGQAGDGWWSLCPACRQRLADRQADHLAHLAPTHCMKCQEPMQGPPTMGVVYCFRCQCRLRLPTVTAPADQDGGGPWPKAATP